MRVRPPSRQEETCIHTGRALPAALRGRLLLERHIQDTQGAAAEPQAARGLLRWPRRLPRALPPEGPDAPRHCRAAVGRRLHGARRHRAARTAHAARLPQAACARARSGCRARRCRRPAARFNGHARLTRRRHRVGATRLRRLRHIWRGRRRRLRPPGPAGGVRCAHAHAVGRCRPGVLPPLHRGSRRGSPAAVERDASGRCPRRLRAGQTAATLQANGQRRPERAQARRGRF